jgi:hypothetical protein
MVARWLLAAALLLPLTSPAFANCSDDIKDMKPKIDHIKYASPGRYALALGWWGKATEASGGSEVECLNFLTRAERALTQPLPEIADCTGANAALARCQGYYGPVQAVQPAAVGIDVWGPGGNINVGGNNNGTFGSNSGGGVGSSTQGTNGEPSENVR